VYKVLENRIRKALKHHIHERYKIDVPVVLARPPQLSMGEVASPLCFELAKQMKKPPRALAQEIANSLKPIAGVARIDGNPLPGRHARPEHSMQRGGSCYSLAPRNRLFF